MTKRRSKNLLKISDVAKQVGVLPSTVRYYTDIGLLKVTSETPGGHRLYDRESTVATINRVQFLNRQGMSIDNIKKELLVSGGKKKILVIDDELEFCNVAVELVETSFPEYEIKTVNDGFTAGRTLSEYLPDLIILDLMLPGVNGFDVCKHIRSSEFMNGVKILAITGYDSTENREHIMSCGANDYLAKPMDLSTLKDKIKSLLK